jgi:hypothetical protein
MRASADFDPHWAGAYFLPRATVVPPASLTSAVWPALDDWKDQFANPESSGVELNLAAGAFLELLDWLRLVLLQDSVLMRKAFPDHPIFLDPLFSSPEYGLFAAKVEDACSQVYEDSRALAIEKAVPEIAEQMRKEFNLRLTLERSAERRHAEVVSAINLLKQSIDTLSQATYFIELTPNRRHASQRVESRREQQRGQEASLTPPSVHLSGVSSRPTSQAQALFPQPASISTAAPTSNQPPSFTLPRTIDTVQNLLGLWRRGMGIMPSIDSLEQTWGSRWRPKSEKNFFSTRKSIIDEVVKRAIASGLPELEVARRMDLQRGKDSLDKLMKSLRKERNEA